MNLAFSSNLRRPYEAIRQQVPGVRTTLVISMVGALIIIIGIYVASLMTKTPIADFTRDPAAVLHGRFYIGMLSNLGVMVWSAAAGACLLGGLIINGNNLEARESRFFLIVSGLICVTLMADDAFMFHEEVFPHALHISEKFVYLGYAVLIAWYMLRFRIIILDSDYLILGIAFFFLGLSVLSDKILPSTGIATFGEDAFKFTGIVFWLAYYIRTVAEQVRKNFMRR